MAPPPKDRMIIRESYIKENLSAGRDLAGRDPIPSLLCYYRRRARRRMISLLMGKNPSMVRLDILVRDRSLTTAING